ncbi:MAG: hypothetical protein ACERKU_06425, partial [Nitrospirota bacterium]
MDPRRLYSALVFVPLLYVGIRYSPSWLFSLLIGTVALFALWEFLSLYFPNTSSIRTKGFSCLITALLLVMVHKGVPEILLVGLLGIVAIIMAGFFISPIAAK